MNSKLRYTFEFEILFFFANFFLLYCYFIILTNFGLEMSLQSGVCLSIIEVQVYNHGVVSLYNADVK